MKFLHFILIGLLWVLIWILMKLVVLVALWAVCAMFGRMGLFQSYRNWLSGDNSRMSRMLNSF